MPERRICVGVITGAHGVRGLVRIHSFTTDPDDVAAYGPVTDEAGGRRFEITPTGHTRGQTVARIEGIKDRDAAEALKGVRLYVPRSALPDTEDEEEYYHADLIGLMAFGADGKEIGRIQAVYDFGAGDLLEVGQPNGRAIIVPFTRAAVPEIDIANGRLVVIPPPEQGNDEAT